MTAELHSLIIYVLLGYSLLYPLVRLCFRLFSLKHPRQRLQLYLLALVIPPMGFVLYHTLLTKRCRSAAPYGLGSEETLHILCSLSGSVLPLIMPFLVIMPLLGLLKIAAAWQLISRLRVRSAAPSLELSNRVEAALQDRCLKMNISQPELIFSSRPEYTAFTAGLFRPVLVLNSILAEQLTDNELDILITHELLHIKKRDTLKGWLLHLLSKFVFFNPLTRALLRGFFLERECLCDRRVANLTGQPLHAYAAVLLKVWRMQLKEMPFQSVLNSAFAGSGRDMEYRIGTLIQRETQSQMAPLPFYALIITITIGSIIFLGMVC